VFYRGQGGKVAAVEDFCPHRGAPLSLGFVRDGNLVCGYHGLEMGCEGKVISMPGQRVRGFPCIGSYAVEERYGFIWVWPGDQALADPLVLQVAAACQHAGRITQGAFTDQLPDEDGVLGFDPTGLVKGWAADRAASRLADLPKSSFCLNAGGDVVVGGALGSGGGPGQAWRVGIEDPRDRSRIAEVVEIQHGGVATSGTAARGAHLYDPATGRFVDREGSVTVVGPSLMWADVWATALFVGPPSLSQHFSEVALGYRAISL